MWELLCCKPLRKQMFKRRVIIIVPLVFWALFITARRTSSPREVTVPKLQLTANSQETFEGKIIIVGAGAAGLFAGYTLQYLGIDNFEILEASGTTFGGRAQELETNSFVDVPLDLGPEWIHVHPKILKDLLLFEETEPMPETIVYRPQTYASFNNEKLHRHDWFRYFYAETKFRTTTWYSYLQQFIHPHVSNQLQLDAAVKTIDYSDPEMVQVTTTDGRVYETKHVIVAVPISILQNEDIQFLPAPPPRKQRAWDSVEMAPGLKVWIEFDRDFYPDTLIPGPLFSLIYQDKIYFDALWGKPSDHHVLALFEVGQRAWDHVELENDREIVDSVLEELDDIFDGQASRHYLQHYVQNWSREPFIQGAYSYNWNTYWNDIAPMKESLEKRIYFCGEYLAKYNLATVHGAALSGREVAQRLVLDQLENENGR